MSLKRTYIGKAFLAHFGVFRIFSVDKIIGSQLDFYLFYFTHIVGCQFQNFVATHVFANVSHESLNI